ncbi:hypothetical protein MRX96_014228 [Rhipicephalus microplus]
MVTTPVSGKSTTTVVGPATVLALLFIAGYTGCVASGPGEVVFETDEGNKCAPTEPYCVTVDNCPKAQRDIRRGQHPTICDWRGTVSLVCCTEPTSLPPVTPEPQSPVEPPVVPPVGPPVEPPVQPPVEPPVQPPVEPPIVPPVQPPIEPPVEPPVEPSVAPPVNTPLPEPNPPTPLPGLSSADGTGLPDTPPGGTSGGRDTSGGDDCDCEEGFEDLD